jgi:Flp pilus assembly protein protease CpaA
MLEPNLVQWGVVSVASLVVAVLDIRTRRIPNVLTLPLLGGGLVYALGAGGIAGLGDALGACLLLALPYVLLFVFAGGGAGDAKMMGAIGAWLGLQAGVIVLVAVGATGAVLGLLRILAHRQRRSVLGRLYATLYILMMGVCSGRAGWTLLKTQLSEEGRIGPTNGRTRLTIPYGPVIFMGVCIGALVVHLWIE